MTEDYSAEFGNSGAQVSVVIKSGTNSFHGAAYDFLRNDVFDARGFFDTPNPVNGKSKPLLRYNQAGGSLGGPIKRNKWFFFGNYEATRDHDYGFAKTTVPTVAELAGNFSALSAPIYDYTTGQPFPGNIIPQNRLSTKIQTILNSVPFLLPPNVNLPGGINLFGTVANIDTINQETARVDGRITDRDSLFVRASIQNETFPQTSILPLNGSLWYQNGRNATIGWTHVFSPHVVNDFRLGYLRPNFLEDQQASKCYAQQLFSGLVSDPALCGTPAMAITGFTTYGSLSNLPYGYLTVSSSASDTLSYIRGPHVLKMGIDVRRRLYDAINPNGERGIFTNTGYFTAGPLNPSGTPAADFVLGLPQTITAQVGLYHTWNWDTRVNGFIQDDWKANRKLTINMGLRYEYRSPFVEQQLRSGTIDLSYPGGRDCTPNQAVVAKYNDPYLGGNCPRGSFPTQSLFAPRFGFAYRPFANNNTVLRGGIGWFYDTYQMNETGLAFGAAPFTTSESVTYSVATPPDLSSLFPVVSSPAPMPPMTQLGVAQNARTAYAQQWNFDVQRELKSNWVVDLGYLGTKGVRLNERNEPCLGQIINGTIVFPYYNMGACLIDMTDAKSNYSGMTLRVEKRFSQGFYFQTNYTWSHTLATGNSTTQVNMNYWDRNADYSNANYNIPQRIVLSGIWELPFGKGKRYGSNLTGAADILSRGWQLNSLYTIQNGFQYRVTATYTAGTGGGYTAGSFRANLVGNPQAGVDGGCRQTVSTCLAFNRAAFAQPAALTFGNEGQNILRGKGFNNGDFSIFKNTYVTENLNVQFRAEFFNLFNHTQLGPTPGASLANPSAMGIYTSLMHAPRIAQLALKLVF